MHDRNYCWILLYAMLLLLVVSLDIFSMFRRHRKSSMLRIAVEFREGITLVRSELD